MRGTKLADMGGGSNLEAMRQDVWAVLKHMVQSDTETVEQQHDYCPKDGWCNFWKSRDNYDDEKTTANRVL